MSDVQYEYFLPIRRSWLIYSYKNEVDHLKNYLVILFQLMVWSGYTLVEWLSVNDRFVFKVFMFLVFSYLAIYIGKMILKSNRRTMLVTVISLLCYGILQILLETLVPVY